MIKLSSCEFNQSECAFRWDESCSSWLACGASHYELVNWWFKKWEKKKNPSSDFNEVHPQKKISSEKELFQLSAALNYFFIHILFHRISACSSDRPTGISHKQTNQSIINQLIFWNWLDSLEATTKRRILKSRQTQFSTPSSSWEKSACTTTSYTIKTDSITISKPDDDSSPHT